MSTGRDILVYVGGMVMGETGMCVPQGMKDG